MAYDRSRTRGAHSLLAGRRAGYKQLVRELGLGGGRERRLLLEQLARLTLRGQLVQLDREHWSFPNAPSRSGSRPSSGSSGNLIAGRLDLHRDGYGFVRPNRQSGAPGAPRAAEIEDVFIPPNEIGDAMQGDQVLVDVDPPKADGRTSGRILRILERRNPTVVGTFRYADPGRGYRQNVVIPFDERMTQPIVIPPGAEIPLAAASSTPHRVLGREALSAPKPESAERDGLVVDVEITSWPTPTRPPIGRVIEILGAPDDFGVDVEMMIRKHQLPRIFPDNVLAEARSVAHLDPEAVAGRAADFRGLPIVTIDGETARDFDDAVLVTERTDGGYELQVHIADVAEYVQPNSALDLEARLRGNSVYFPDRAIPMLPQELSTDICSLRPHEDRLVLSCIMQLDAAARIESFEIVEGVIRSAARMTYTEVHAILEGDAEIRTRYASLVENFERMKRLAVLMNQRREERGSIDFDLPEPVIEFDERGEMRGVTRSERTWANRLIEEFMLAANECVAVWIEELGVPSLYRIHEKPEPRRVVEFEETRRLLSAIPWSWTASGKACTNPRRASRCAWPWPQSAPARSPGGHRRHSADVSKANRAHRRQARRAHSELPHAALAQTGALLRSERRPFRAGCPHLHPLHFAHPPLSRPHRAPHHQGAAPRRSLRPKNRDPGAPRFALVASHDASRPQIRVPTFGSPKDSLRWELIRPR